MGGPIKDAPVVNGAPNASPFASAPAEPPRREAPALTLESKLNSTARGPKSLRVDADSKSAAKDKDAPREKEGATSSNAGKLRMSVEGEHLYAEIKASKIVLNDRTYDSLVHARDSVRRERNKVAVWEYFDEGVKSWRVLNRD